MATDQARQVVSGALTDEPQSTSALYDRVGYPALTRVGLIAYQAFRDTLAELEADGRATSATDADGATVWRRVSG